MAQSIRGELTEWLRFLQAETHLLKHHPKLIYQQAANSPPQSAVANRAAQVEQQGRWPRRPWLRRLLRPSAVDPCLMALTGHTGAVEALAVSADGSLLASGDSSGSLRIWDTRSGQEKRSFAAHADGVAAVALSRDGRLLISSGGKQGLALWDMGSGRKAAEVQYLSAGKIRALAATPDDKCVISANEDGTIVVWSFESLALERSFRGNAPGLTASVAVTPDGGGILTGGAQLKLLDIGTGRELWSLDGHNGHVKSVAVSPDGRIVVSGGSDGQIVVWDTTSRRSLSRMSIAEAVRERDSVPHIGIAPRICSVAVMPDGRGIVATGYDRTVWIWSAETGRLLDGLDGHSNWVLATAVTRDGRLFSAGADGSVRAWQPVAAGSAPRTVKVALKGIDLCQDGQRALFRYQDGSCKIVDARSGEETRTFRLPEGEAASAARMTRDGKHVVLGGDKGSLELWDARTGDKLRTLRRAKTRLPKNSVTTRPHEIKTLSLLSDGRRLILWNKILDLPTGRAVRTLRGWSNAFSSDGRWIATADLAGPASTEKVVQLSSVETSRVVRRLKPPHWAFQFIPDSGHIACAAAEGGVEISDVESGEVAMRIAKNQKSPFSLGVSPDGRFIVLADEKRTSAWDTETGRLQWNGQPGEQILYSSDGRFFLCRGSVFDSANGDTVALSGLPDLSQTAGSLILAQDEAGSHVLLELCGTENGPWIVTAEQDRDRLVFLCSHCQTESVCTAPSLGTVTGCPQCGQKIKLNPFTLRRKQPKEYASVSYLQFLWLIAGFFLIALPWYAGIAIWKANGKTNTGLITMLIVCFTAVPLLLNGLFRLKERK
jgi:WD40 repeat protein